MAPGVGDPKQSLWLQLMLAGIDRSFRDLTRAVPTAPLAVETMEGFPFAWQAELVAEHDLGICCDVGHLVVRGDDPAGFIEAWLPRIRQIHLHGVREQFFSGNMRRRIDHRPLGGPGELVDVPGLLRLLEARGFRGPVIVESRSRADLAQSVAALRRAMGE